MLGTAGAVGTDWASQQRQTAVLEAQNAAYARINNGIGAYMTLYYPHIIDRSTYPDSCAKVSYPASGSPDKSCYFAASYTDAAGASKTHQVTNILQPTLADLQTLGLVDREIPAAPLLPVHATVVTGGATGNAAAKHDNIYGIVIKRTPAGTDINLDSLVFNVQPYALVQADMSGLLRMSNGVGASSGLPDRDATTSSINPQFDLKAYAGAWSVPNPVQQRVKNVTTGLPGILAWRNGYAAAVALELIRRDGSLKPTADWDFANHSITNLKELEAQHITTSTLTANGAAKLNSTLDVTGTLTALGKMVVQGATDIQSLVVNGEATFKAPVKMEKSLDVAGQLNAKGGVSTAHLNIENGTQLTSDGARLLVNGDFVTLGTKCAQNLALAQDTTGRLMMCAAGSWQTANNNYGLSQVNAGDSCSPDGSAAYLPNGLMAICREHKWQPAAMGSQVSGQSCTTKGMMAAEITAQGVANLLVCKAGSGSGLAWSASIYARPKAEVAKEGDSCNTDQVNALASNRNGDESGILRCTSNGSGGAQWKLPFKKYTEEIIDTGEYLVVDFSWREYWYHPALGLQGQTVQGEKVHLTHWKNGVPINSWANKQETRGLDKGLYFFRNREFGGNYPDDNYSRMLFKFNPPMNPSEWTKPKFRRPSSSCTNCYFDDDGKAGGPDRRYTNFQPDSLEIDFYNNPVYTSPGVVSLRGNVSYYQFVMFKKKRWTYLTTE
ncbi:Large exoprotein involved in heme utilization or adhesion [Herbaspirillum frisingense GSF30]|uniref:Large exoprotein involved in heme utilization or adhesion n=1 Tax=Herbaspirillum frisingense GSF30 TaxID=864073 RepID=A0AAI9ICT4_9BURK|nr:hypothetical protein [Herbaspirillum frisingense]EOA03736.1 Large exoprotein involved in heme utilization or adhesion [Herbaspirillum frisingense GSF30]